eukprot:9440859-Prorocentrum_lima.AAC.1
MLNDELHREQVRARSTVEIIEARHSTFNTRVDDMVMQGQNYRDREHQRAVLALEETAQHHHDSVVKTHKEQIEEQLQLKQAKFEEHMQQ